MLDNGYHAGFVIGVGDSTELWWHARIQGDPFIGPEFQGERSYCAPVRSDEDLDLAGDQSVLGECLIKSEGLPVIDVVQHGTWKSQNKRIVDRGVAGIVVEDGLVGAVAGGKIEDCRRDTIAKGGGTHTKGRRVVGIVSQRRQLSFQCCQGVARVDRKSISVGQDAICGIADCLVSGSGNVDSGCRFVV